jgi:fluoride exporter
LIVLVLLAAAAGAVVRWLLGARLNTEFPLGTLVANLTAAFAAGLFAGVDDPTDLVVRVGLLGALSTWSTLANELAEMLRSGDRTLAAIYGTTSIVLGIGLAWIGLQVSG